MVSLRSVWISSSRSRSFFSAVVLFSVMGSSLKACGEGTDALRVRRRGSSAPGAASSRFGTVPDIVDESLPFLRHSRLTEADPAVPALDEILEAIGPATAVGAVGPAGARGRGVIGVGLGPRQLGHLSAELVAVSAGVDVELPCHEHPADPAGAFDDRSEEHTSELQSRGHLVCRLLLEKKKKKTATLHMSKALL